MTPSQDEILKWMTNRGYYLRHDHLLQRGDAGDGKGPDVLHPSYSLFFTDGGSGTRRIGVFTGRFDWALQQAYHAAGEDWEQRKPERFLSFIRNDEIHAQVPCTLRDDEAIAIDTFLRNIGKLTEDEEVATTEVMTSRHGYKLDDPALIQLVMAEDATTAFTTWERMARHLLKVHGLEESAVLAQSQQGLEDAHNGLHETILDHEHPKRIVVCGYEPRG